MTSTTPDPAHAAAAPPAYQLPQRVTQARVLRSEWTKLRTQPSVFWALLATMILIAGFGILYSLVRETRPPHGAAAIAAFDPAAVSLSGVQLAQIAVGVLGVLLVTSEYASGLIRTTLAAVPRRLPVLWGKAVLVTVPPSRRACRPRSLPSWPGSRSWPSSTCRCRSATLAWFARWSAARCTWRSPR